MATKHNTTFLYDNVRSIVLNRFETASRELIQSVIEQSITPSYFESLDDQTRLAFAKFIEQERSDILNEDETKLIERLIDNISVIVNHLLDTEVNVLTSSPTPTPSRRRGNRVTTSSVDDDENFLRRVNTIGDAVDEIRGLIREFATTLSSRLRRVEREFIDFRHLYDEDTKKMNSEIRVLTARMDEQNKDLTTWKNRYRIPDALHVLINFIKVIQHHIKLDILREGISECDQGYKRSFQELVELSTRSLASRLIGYGLSITDYHQLVRLRATVNHTKHALAVTPAEARPYVDELSNDDEKHLFNRLLDCIERNEWSLTDAE